MKEIEVKILDINPKQVVARLKRLKAKKVEQGIVRFALFDYPDGRLLKNNSFVRVRTLGGRTELVMKMPVKVDNYKKMEEIETTVGDYDAVVKILESLGLKKFYEIEKYRATYKLGKTKFELDKIPRVPWFMEVESDSEKYVDKGVKALGFNMSDTTSIRGDQVCRKYGVKSKFFTFKKFKESPNYTHLFR